MARVAFYPRPPDAAIDPDIFVPASNRSKGRAIGFSRMLKPVVLTAAAAAAVAALVWFMPKTSSPTSRVTEPAVAQMSSPFLHLPDDSEVELKAGSKIAEHFTAAERRVRLVVGEAHFTVAKNPLRPFIVEAGDVVVRAVGTAFDVRLGKTVVDVLVTEGTVQIRPESTQVAAAPASNFELPTLVAGQHTTVPAVVTKEWGQPVIETLAAPEIDRALAWQTGRLVFDGTPLAEVVLRFNRHSAGQQGTPHLVLADPELDAIPISGRIRSDSIDSFVDALEESFYRFRTASVIKNLSKKCFEAIPSARCNRNEKQKFTTKCTKDQTGLASS